MELSGKCVIATMKVMMETKMMILAMMVIVMVMVRVMMVKTMMVMVSSKEHRWSCWASATARIPNIPVLAKIFRSRW